MLSKRILQFILVALLFPALTIAQTTTSSLGGSVKTNTGEPLVGATVTVTHEPTGTVTRVQSRTGGRFDVSNLNPGGPYSVEVSFINFATEKRSDIYLSLGDSYKVDLVLSSKAANLAGVTVTGTRKTTEFNGKGGSETVIGRDKMASLPTVGRNIYDYLRAVPQARLIGGNEGALTIAGQNNRYNSFYVDGAINNDVFGLANSGTNGGQTGAAPISIDAIDQFQVVISPYDASVGNFTGGGINAITKSGSNKTEGSVYYFYRNQNLAGYDPIQPKETTTRYPDFTNKTYGGRVGGALVKNKVFYFLSFEKQRDQTPQPYDFSTYKGNTNTAAGIQGLIDFVKSTYKYDMGEYLNNIKSLNADRITAKVDWNISNKQKLSVSYRYNKGVSTTPSANSATSINFYNGGVYFPSTTNSVSAELKSIVGRSSTNKLLVTYSNVNDDRSFLGDPFPRTAITDGSGTITFGSENSSTQNILIQKNVSLVDNFKFNIGSHSLTAGVDYEYFDDKNAFIQNTFGNYRYGSLAAFTANTAAPTSYQVGYPLIDNDLTDNTGAAAKFKVSKTAFYLTDEVRPTENLTLNYGLRADIWQFITTPATDAFTNDSALSKFAQYYDLKGARSGQKPNFPISFSPRFGFTYKIPEENMTIRGGFGVFTGRMPLVWPGGTYNNNGLFVGGFTASGTALSAIRFRWDPTNPLASIWNANSVGVSLTKGPLNLISKDFRMPKLWRMSLAIDKKFENGWSATMEGMFSKNINEINYTNINILPPIGISLGPGPRNVYNTESSSLGARIPIRANGTNPYDNAILVSNNDDGDKGFAYNFSVTVDKKTRTGFNFNFNYAYGNSYVWNESTSSVNLSQWANIEATQGRNYTSRNISDFSQGHRIFVYINKKFTYAHNTMATTVGLVYTGQSGTPVSYTYSSGSAIRDAGTGGLNDLIYIPTSGDLGNMTFLSNTIGTTTYTPQQQKDALEAYIQGDDYLKNRRGQFAERNGARLPFSNTVDLKVTQDFNVKVSGHRYQFQLTWDVFNFTNMLNRDWGRSYFASFDQYALINFAGYVSNANLTPQYRFNPTIKNLWNYNTSAAPAYSNRWISQIGLRFNF